jgi:hypothetical protein
MSPSPRREVAVSYLQCPECRLTVPASAYYLRGDTCPRCLTPMEPRERLRATPQPPQPAAVPPAPPAATMEA